MCRHQVQAAEAAGMAAHPDRRDRPARSLCHRHLLHSPRHRAPHHSQQR